MSLAIPYSSLYRHTVQIYINKLESESDSLHIEICGNGRFIVDIRSLCDCLKKYSNNVTSICFRNIVQQNIQELIPLFIERCLTLELVLCKLTKKIYNYIKCFRELYNLILVDTTINDSNSLGFISFISSLKKLRSISLTKTNLSEVKDLHLCKAFQGIKYITLIECKIPLEKECIFENSVVTIKDTRWHNIVNSKKVRF